MKYSEKLKDPRWKLIAKGVKERDGNRCRVCNSKENLDAHHRAYRGDPWEAPLGDIITLCRDCHSKWHSRVTPNMGKGKNNAKY